MVCMSLTATLLASCVTTPTGPTTSATTRPASTRPAPVVGRGGGADAGGAPAILEPSQGQPVILRPQDRFYFLLRLDGPLDGDIYVTLVHARLPELYYPLALTGKMTVEPGRHASMVLQVPADAPDGLYDLRARVAGGTLVARHSVRVVREYKSRFRFVHLSNMNVGDPTAPTFDPLLPPEVNLLAPEFIVATGNYLEPGSTNGGADAWRRTLDYLTQFDAPVYILCGARDDEATYSPLVARSPIGSFEYGPVQGILLLQHAGRPMDTGQIDFVHQVLAEHSSARFNFLAMNGDDPTVLRVLAGTTPVSDFIKANRIGMLLCGGDADWDGREYADVLTTMPDLAYVRTHASSTTRQGRATGRSHYRVIEVDADRIAPAWAPGCEPVSAPSGGPAGAACPSYAVGGLGVTLTDDGQSPPGLVQAAIRNTTDRPVADACVWLRLRKNGDAQPKVAGGRLAQVLDGRQCWLCEVRVDVPDRGGVRVAASVDRALPAPPPIAVEIVGDNELTFTPDVTPTGLSFARSAGHVAIRLRNTAASPVVVRPVVRLCGQVLGFAGAIGAEWPITIPAGETVERPVELLLPDPPAGEHYVQVYFLDDPLQRMLLRPVVLHSVSATQPAPAP